MASIHFSKVKQDWATPDYVFDPLNDIFEFTIDCAASEDNARCEIYASASNPEYMLSGMTAWCNPPYSPTSLCARLVSNLVQGCINTGSTGVILLPARTDTALWHTVLFPNCDVFFYRSRIKFKGAVKDRAPFPSALAIINATAEQLLAIETDERIKGKLFRQYKGHVDVIGNQW